jgi:ABC-2 type transport system ATP-binding protein
MSIQEMFALVHLKVAPNIVVKKLSLGMKQRFLLGLTLLHQPEILLLDEPFNGVDPRGVELFKKILTNLAKDKIILISSHNLKDLEDMVSDVVLLKDGKILKRESIDQIRTSYARGLTDYFIQEGEKDVAIET